MVADIYHISQKDLNDKHTLFNFIYPNLDLTYYVSDDFSPSFYIDLARAGFISVSDYVNDSKQYLFPEMQQSYAVLDFENLHISKKVKKLLKDESLYSFTVDQNFEKVLELIDNYHKDNWMKGKYLELLKELKTYNDDKSFKLISVELKSKSGELVAGEIGYKIEKTYTSLSGFSDKKYNNYGKLQMVLLAKYLESNSFSFWNLGHPYMQYKLDLGAKVLPRNKFLNRWLKELNSDTIF